MNVCDVADERASIGVPAPVKKRVSYLGDKYMKGLFGTHGIFMGYKYIHARWVKIVFDL